MSTERANPHDTFFKSLFGRPEIAADFLQSYLPESVTAQLDLAAPELVQGSYVDEELQEFFSDLLYRVRAKSGSRIFVHVLLEHKSAPDKWVLLQLFGYLFQFWTRARKQKVRKLPLIIPVVIYHGREQWQIAGNFRDLVEGAQLEAWRRYVPEFEYHLCDLNRYADKDIRGAAPLKTGLLLLKYIFRRELDEQLLQILSRLSGLSARDLRDYLIPMIWYLMAARPRLTLKKLKGALEQTLSEAGVRIMETIAESLINEGRQAGRQEGRREGRREGRQEGRQEGRREEAVAILLRLLRRRFGALSARAEAQIGKLSLTQLEQLGEALLDFKKPADLTAWLRRQ